MTRDIQDPNVGLGRAERFGDIPAGAGSIQVDVGHQNIEDAAGPAYRRRLLGALGLENEAPAIAQIVSDRAAQQTLVLHDENDETIRTVERAGSHGARLPCAEPWLGAARTHISGCSLGSLRTKGHSGNPATFVQFRTFSFLFARELGRRSVR